MKINDHYLLAHEIACYAKFNTQQSLLLLVMDKKEYKYYIDKVLEMIPDDLLTRRQDHRQITYNMRLKNGSKIRIIRYHTQKDLDCQLCGCHIDKWWTTGILPEKAIQNLYVCSVLN